MMELVTLSALRAAQLVWRPAHGGFVLTVVCKATFALRPGLSPLSPSQQPVATADVYSDDGGALQVASDLVPLKKQPEVMLTGQAYAPGGQRVSSFAARLVVGEIDKTVRLDGDRTFGVDGQPTEPAPFVRMPLVWQRAAGGPETANPAGRSSGASAQPDAYGRILAPNLLPPDFQLRSRNDVVPIVGFGPLAPFWPARARCLHRHAAGWDPARWPERPLPDDIDLAYFNAAPADQRRAAPFAEELLSLENLHPLFAQLSTRLAPVTPSATVERGQGSEALQLRCDTLLIDSDRGLAMLVWRAHVVLERPDQPGRVVVTHAEAGEVGAARPAAPMVFDQTQAADVRARGPGTLPFSNRAGGEGVSPEATSVSPASSRDAGAAAARALLSGSTLSVDALFGATMAFGFSNAAPATPFQGSGDSPPSSREVPAGETGRGLPFLPSGSAASPFVAPPQAAPTARLPLSPITLTPEQVAALAAAPESTAPPAAAPESTAPLAVAPAAMVPAAVRPSPELGLPASPVTDSPAPPALLGAGAGPEAPAGSAASEASTPSQPAAQVQQGTSAEVPQGRADVDVYPPARCGAIAARLDCHPGKAVDLLRAEDLDTERWERVHEHWQDHVDAEASRGRTGPRAEYDSAYVAALEAERLPITVEVYARLAAAGERGALDEGLAELDFPEDAWLHIQRSWLPRMIADPKLGAQVRAAIAAAR